MEIQIKKEKENPLFRRKEIEGMLTLEKTPSRQETLKALAEKFSVPPEAVKIKSIKGKYGSRDFDIEANVYSSRENKEALELKKKKDTELEKKAAEKLQRDVSDEGSVNDKQPGSELKSNENVEPQDEINKPETSE